MNSIDITSLASYWDAKAPRELTREQEDPAKVVHTDLLLRLINRHLPSPTCTILDAGGGAGRFSIPLCVAGHKVTHIDLSMEMMQIAKANLAACGSESVDFIQGSITDLSCYSDRYFDLVICIDSPISFCYKDYGKALDELTRVSAEKVVFSVMNRTSMIITGGVDFDLTHYGKLKTVKAVYDTGDLIVDKELLELHANLMPSWHAFTPEEIEGEIKARGFRVSEISATGALSFLTKKELLQQLIVSEAYSEYLDFEERFDSNRSLLGIGYSGGSGLTIAAYRV
jgi:ubiquinone/menaquinone biosynthesis C-methylase UbiE